MASHKKRNLTDRTLNALKREPAPRGATYDVMDTRTPGFGVRVSETGRQTFILVARYGAGKNPTRRALGVNGAISVESARTKARNWLDMIAKGIDPSQHEATQRLANERRRANSFSAIAEDFIREKLSKERKGAEIEQDIRRDLIPEWGALPGADITDDMVAASVKKKAKKTPSQARNLLGTIKRFFQWAIDQRSYGLKTNPAVGLKPASLCGEKVVRKRILSDDELFALWRAVKRMNDNEGKALPQSLVYQLLIRNALRLNEAARASRPEVDFAKRLWTIPAERMKGKNGKALPHVVPLTDECFNLFEKLPRYKKGAFLFTTTFGEAPISMSDKIKKRLDERMLRTLRALAKVRGDDPRKVTLPHWVNHDIRRTVRSNLSRLKISEEAREAVLAHVRPGLKGTYDHHDYLDEKREALELWGQRLRLIVEPKYNANVVPLRAAQ